MKHETDPPWIHLITGTPGTGKTTVAKALAKRFKGVWINERVFAKKNKVGRLLANGEWEIPLPEMKNALNAFLKKRKKPVFLDGHVLCEIRLPVNQAIVLSCDPIELERRLKKRRYSHLKLLDNVWAEKNAYCWKQARRVHAQKAVRVAADGSIKETLQKCFLLVKKRVKPVNNA